MERRLAAVLAADVAGYSRLMGIDEEGTLARLKAIRKTLVDPTIASHRGRIVKTTGDGMLVEFASAVDAVRGAVEVQSGMAEQNASVPQDVRIEFRIGIHVGDIIIDDNDIFGDGVNIAARLEGIAEAGGVCISDDAQRQIRGMAECLCDDWHRPDAFVSISFRSRESDTAGDFHRSLRNRRDRRRHFPGARVRASWFGDGDGNQQASYVLAYPTL